MLRRCALVAACELARERVPLPEERERERPEAVSDHLRDGDRLAERPAEPESHRRHDAASHVRDDDAPTISHLVAPRPIDASLTSRGTVTKSSRQIDEVIGIIMIVSTTIAWRTPACSAGPGEDRDPAEVVPEKRLDVHPHERAEHEDAPEPDHDARHGGEHLDRASRSPRGQRAARAR